MWMLLLDHPSGTLLVEKSQFEGMSQEKISKWIADNSTKVSFSEHVKSVAKAVIADVPAYLKASFGVYLVMFVGIYFLVKLRGKS